jgi:hypothetical protein
MFVINYQNTNQGPRCLHEVGGLAKANACLWADDGDACGRRPPLEVSFMCPLISPHRLIFWGHLGLLGRFNRLVPAVVSDSCLSSLRRRWVCWCCS